MDSWMTQTALVNHRGTAEYIIPGTNVCIVVMSDPAGNDAVYKFNTKKCEVQLVHEGPHLSHDSGRIGWNRISADDKYLVREVDGYIVVMEIDTWSTVWRDDIKLDNNDHLAYVVGNYIIRYDKRNGTMHCRSSDDNFQLKDNQLSQIFAAKHHLVTCGGGSMAILDMRSMKQTIMRASCITYIGFIGLVDGILCRKVDDEGDYLYDLAATNLTTSFNRFQATICNQSQDHRYLVSFLDGTVLFKHNYHFVSVRRGQVISRFEIPPDGYLESIRKVGSNMFTYVTQDKIFLFTTSGDLAHVGKQACSERTSFSISTYGKTVVIFCFHCNTFQSISKIDPDSENEKSAETADKHNLSTTIPTLCSSQQTGASLRWNYTFNRASSASGRFTQQSWNALCQEIE